MWNKNQVTLDAVSLSYIVSYCYVLKLTWKERALCGKVERGREEGRNGIGSLSAAYRISAPIHSLLFSST